jgi:hypothetical protein
LCILSGDRVDMNYSSASGGDQGEFDTSGLDISTRTGPHQRSNPHHGNLVEHACIHGTTTFDGELPLNSNTRIGNRAFSDFSDANKEPDLC